MKLLLAVMACSLATTTAFVPVPATVRAQKVRPGNVRT